MTSSILVAVLMGSQSDWAIMESASLTLTELQVPHEARALSAHRTPDALYEYIQSAEKRGVQVFIAAAGGAAHLAGVVASKTLRPVLGVPLPSSTFVNGLDSLLATVQMPGGIPVGTLAVGKPGAVNAALLATSILGIADPQFREAIKKFREKQAQAVLDKSHLK